MALRLAKLDRLADPDDVLQWVAAEARECAGIGIDAPIVIPNASGMRVADRLAHSLYGKFHAGAYPASRARGFWKRTTGLSTQLARMGFAHGDELPPKTPCRFQVEVHPHAAAVQLFKLEQIVKYKKGTLAARAAALQCLRTLMLERLPRLTPSLSLGSLPEIPTRGKELKEVEDQLDAVLAAYIVAHWWYWGRERNDVLGNAKLGYIVVPRRLTPEWSPAHRRVEYKAGILDESHLDSDPMVQFQKWFDEARAAGIEEANAMTLATTSADGRPSARMVLLKDVSENRFVFFTNYKSQKGRELAENAKAALVFYWPDLHRQVRISGEVTKAARAEAESYFATRPRGAQLAAWASWQSSVIPDRAVLESRMKKLEAKYEGQPIPTPPSWGGYRLRPATIEFWQGRIDRLHDRLRYEKSGSTWKIDRLAP
jgi:pyridoxamine 5'-phosphate oxidase